MERALRERYKRVFDEKTGYCIEYRLDDDEGVFVERYRFELGDLKLSELFNIEVTMLNIIKDTHDGKFRFFRVVDDYDVSDDRYSCLVQINTSTAELIRTLKRRVKAVTRRYVNCKDRGYIGLIDNWFWVMCYELDELITVNQKLYSRLYDYTKYIEIQESVSEFPDFMD